MILSLTTKGSVFWIMVIIGLTRWTGIARLIRAEILKIKNLNYVESATALGYSNLRILLRHVIPNAMGPVIISISFGIASVILIEAFLSFIGIGLPPDIPTWGSMLNMGRQNPTDWWMALFPGLAIFVTVLTFNLLGDGLSKR
jgi:peptide/nickel transport system permease protein